MKPEESKQAYPLAWPLGLPRTVGHMRQRAPFHATEWVQREGLRSVRRNRDRSIDEARQELRAELGRLLGCSHGVISTNQPLRQDGELSGRPLPANVDPGVAVYFQLDGAPYCLPCDKWDRIADNLYAVAKHIEAMRGMQRWGVGTVQQAFAGYKALPASTSKPWWVVLQVDRERATPVSVTAAFREAARSAHPDAGGSEAAMSELNIARGAALAELSGVLSIKT